MLSSKKLMVTPACRTLDSFSTRRTEGVSLISRAAAPPTPRMSLISRAAAPPTPRACGSALRAAGISVALLLTACGGGRGFDPFAKLGANVGDVALSAGTPEVALRLTDAALEKNPNDAEALTRRGEALTELGRLDEARA